MLPDSKISQQIPGLTSVMWQYRVSGPLYEVIHMSADYTKRMIRGGPFSESKKCFTIAGVLQQARTQQLHNGTNQHL